MTRHPKPLRHVLSLVLASGLLAGAVGAGSAAHASGGSPVTLVPIPIHVPCRDLPNDEHITVFAPWTTVEVSGSCFNGSTDYVSVYDVTQGRYLTGTWQTVTANSNGNFFITVSGAQCYDRVEAIAYDTGWNSYTNHGNWQAATVECTPK